MSLVFGLLFRPGLAVGSPASALREYKAGEYEKALKEYEQLLQRRSDDPRLHFNAGAAAYRNKKFDEAAKQFDEALSTPDLKLQQQAYFNRGNTLYWLGEKNPDPTKRTESWEKSLKDFESAGKLNQQDQDSKFNYEYVKRRLEELKQQQQQQSQQNKDQQNKDQQNQDQQQQSQQNKSDQQKNQDQQQNQQQNAQSKQDQEKQSQAQQQQKQQDQKQDSAQQKEQEEKKQQQAANQSQEQKDKQQQQQAKQASAQQGEKSDEKGQQAAAAEGQMTQEQAEQVLDAEKGDEQMLPVKPAKPSDTERRVKDW